MACFKLPRGLCQHIDALIRKFWWGSKAGERKTAWVSWEEMTKPKYFFPLGFSSPSKAILAASICFFIIEASLIAGEFVCVFGLTSGRAGLATRPRHQKFSPS
jgi:hypothetical protein